MAKTEEEILRETIRTNPARAIQMLLEKCGGDIDEAIRRLTNPPCAYAGARQCADAYAQIFGITPADFMKRWRAMR